MKTPKEYWRERFGEYPQTDSEKLAVVMMLEYSQEVVKNYNIPAVVGQSEQLVDCECCGWISLDTQPVEKCPGCGNTWDTNCPPPP